MVQRRQPLLQLIQKVFGLLKLAGEGRDIAFVARHLGTKVGRVAAEQSRGLVENLAQTSHLIVGLCLDGLHALGEMRDVVTQFIALVAGHQAARGQHHREHAGRGRARDLARSYRHSESTRRSLAQPVSLVPVASKDPRGTMDIRLVVIPVRLR